MMQWSEVADVRKRWIGPPLTAEDEQIETLLSDIEDYLLGKERFPDLAERISDGQVRESTVKRVVARIAIRVLRNPEGYRQVTSGTGPFTGSATFGGDHPGEIYVTDEDREDLGGSAKPKTRRAFSIHPGGVR